MNSAIVTGANGFVGCALLKELAAHGVSVTAVVKDEKENVTAIKDLPGVQIICCKMEDLEHLTEKVNKTTDVFYHLAWAGSTGTVRSDYDLQLRNVHWTLDAVNAAKTIGCHKFVGIGTLAELDVNAYTPVDGATPNAVSCYGAAKIAAHYMSKAECNRLDIDHVWARLTNVYGIGNYTSNFVNFAAKIMLTGQPANFTAGEQMYDFACIEDIAQGLYCLGESGKKNVSYFVGSTKPAKLKEFIQIIRDEIDPSITLNLGAVPFNGVSHPQSVFDCSRLVEDTGYHPRVLFQNGIKQTIPWIREQIKVGKI